MSVAQLDVTLDRPLPQSPDAERAVLGAILENPNAFYRVVSVIDTEDFFKDSHRSIFAAIRSLAEKSVTIAAILRDTAIAWLDRYYAEAMTAVVSEQSRAAASEIPVSSTRRSTESVSDRRSLTARESSSLRAGASPSQNGMFGGAPFASATRAIGRAGGGTAVDFSHSDLPLCVGIIYRSYEYDPGR